MQRRFPNGTFASEDPADCSPKDQPQRFCSLGSGNTVGFYESSSWEYSWFAPHDMAHLVTLMGGNVSNSAVPLLQFVVYVDADIVTCTVDDFYQALGSLFRYWLLFAWE